MIDSRDLCIGKEYVLDGDYTSEAWSIVVLFISDIAIHIAYTDGSRNHFWEFAMNVKWKEVC